MNGYSIEKYEDIYASVRKITGKKFVEKKTFKKWMNISIKERLEFLQALTELKTIQTEGRTDLSDEIKNDLFNKNIRTLVLITRLYMQFSQIDNNKASFQHEDALAEFEEFID